MATAFSRKAKLSLALLGSLAALALALISGPAPAQAATSPYCGGWLGGNQGCSGAARWLYQTYGWGDQHAACVGIEAGWALSCSSGAGNGVYSQKLGSARWSSPVIVNGHLSANNFVHGVALQP